MTVMLLMQVLVMVKDHQHYQKRMIFMLLALTLCLPVLVTVI